MKEVYKMKAREIRVAMEQTAEFIDDLQNEYEEYERELEKRGLKI